MVRRAPVTCEEALPPQAAIEFAGVFDPREGGRIERCGRDAVNDWTMTVPPQRVSGIADWTTMKFVTRFGDVTLAWLILRDVYSATIADRFAEAFQEQVIGSFGRKTFRIKTSEISAWHLARCVELAKSRESEDGK